MTDDFHVKWNIQYDNAGFEIQNNTDICFQENYDETIKSLMLPV